MVNALFDNNAGKHERVGLESKLHHDATNNGHYKNIALIYNNINICNE